MSLKLQHKTWDEVRVSLQSLNPELVKIVDSLQPNYKYPIFTVKLPYGTQIFTEGKLNPTLFHQDLIPIGIVLHNYIELFLGGKRPLPFWVLKPGDLLGGSQFINQYFQGDYQPAFCWDVTAGLRSTFLLAKINNANRLSKLYRHYPEMARVNATYETQHWSLFKSIISAEQDPWYNEMLFFSKAWFSHVEDPAWGPFYLYIMGEAIKKLSFVRDNLRWQFIFSRLHEEKFARYQEYVISTVKHLFAIGSAALPGLAPVIDNQGMPLSTLQRIFHDFYQLEYQPIIIGPVSSNLPAQDKYYSFGYPTLIDSAPRLARVSNIEILQQIVHVAGRCFDYFRDPYYADALPMLHRFASQGSFKYYHHLAKSEEQIHSAQKLFDNDSQFTAANEFADLPLPVNSGFLKGCIKIKQ